jgi:hypothetical protein
VADLLEVFKKSLSYCASQDQPTFSYTIPLFRFIITTLQNFTDINASSTLSPVASAALLKIVQYFPTDNPSAVLATFLDPRFNITYFNFSSEVGRLTELCRTTWVNAYSELPYTQSGAANDDTDEVLQFFCNATNMSLDSSEFDRYLREPRLGVRADPLSWWKDQEINYPTLSMMARDYLAVPATSAAAERAFSAGSDLIAPRRCSMGDDTVTECMCVGAWVQNKII